MKKRENLPPQPQICSQKKKEIFQEGITVLGCAQDETRERIRTTMDLYELPNKKALDEKKMKNMEVIWRFIRMTTGYDFTEESIEKESKAAASSMSKARDLWRELYFEDFQDSTVENVIKILRDQTLKQREGLSFKKDATKCGKNKYATKKDALEVLFKKAPAFGGNKSTSESRKICSFLKLTDACMESKKYEIKALQNDSDEFEKGLFGDDIEWIENSIDIKIANLIEDISEIGNQIAKLNIKSQNKTKQEKNAIVAEMENLYSRIYENKSKIKKLKAKKLQGLTCPKKESFYKFKGKKYWIEGRSKNEKDIIFKIARESGFSAKNINITGDLEETEKVKDEVGFRIEAESVETLKNIMKSVFISLEAKRSEFNIDGFELINTNLLNNEELENVQYLNKISKVLGESKKILPFGKPENRGENKKPGSSEKFKNIKVIGNFRIKGRTRTFEIQFVLVGNENETHLSHHAVFRRKQYLQLISKNDGYIRESLALKHVKRAAIESFEKDPSDFSDEFIEWQEAVKNHIFDDHLELIPPEEVGFSSPRFYRFVNNKKVNP